MPTRREPSEFLNLVKIEYQYQEIDIQAVMNARIYDIIEYNPEAFNKPVYVLAAAHNPEYLTITLQGEKTRRSNERILLIPYHILLNPNNKNSGHWVGILLDINENGMADRAIYIDSLRPSEPAPLLQSAYQAIYPGIRLAGGHYMLQNDGTSCGPLMIENLLYAAQHIDAAVPTNTSASYFRALHLACIEHRRRDYYTEFVAQGHVEQGQRRSFSNAVQNNYFKNRSNAPQKPQDILEHNGTEDLTPQDDLLITMVMLSSLMDSVLHNRVSIFTSSEVRTTCRNRIEAVEFQDSKIHLIPKDPNIIAAVPERIEVQTLQSITQEIRETIWKLRKNKQSDMPLLMGKFSILTLATGFGYSLEICAIGAVKRIAQRYAIATAGASVTTASVTSVGLATEKTARMSRGAGMLFRSTLNRRAALHAARAVQVSELATATTAVNTVASVSWASALGNTVVATVTNPWVMVPTLAFGIVQLAQIGTTEQVTKGIQKTLNLYQEADRQKDVAAFAEADTTLCKVMEITGAGTKGSFTTYALISYDQFAYACLVLGVLRVKQGCNNAYELFADAYYYAYEQKTKQQALLWMITVLSHDSPSKTLHAYGESVGDNRRKALLQEKINLLKQAYPDIEKDCHALTTQAIDFVMNMLINNNTAQENIEAFICGGELANIRVLRPYGNLCETVITFSQAICMQSNNIESIQKFRDCYKLAQEIKADRTLDLNNAHDAIVNELLTYMERNVENIMVEAPASTIRSNRFQL